MEAQMERCSFCGKESPEDELCVCMSCGGRTHGYCPPVCCEEILAEAVDGWLQLLAIEQVERL